MPTGPEYCGLFVPGAPRKSKHHNGKKSKRDPRRKAKKA